LTYTHKASWACSWTWSHH